MKSKAFNFVKEAGERVNERVRRKAEFEVVMTLHTLENRTEEECTYSLTKVMKRLNRSTFPTGDRATEVEAGAV